MSGSNSPAGNNQAKARTPGSGTTGVSREQRSGHSGTGTALINQRAIEWDRQRWPRFRER